MSDHLPEESVSFWSEISVKILLGMCTDVSKHYHQESNQSGESLRDTAGQSKGHCMLGVALIHFISILRDGTFLSCLVSPGPIVRCR